MHLLIPRAGDYNILLRENNQETLIGQLIFELEEPPPLTDARKRAIRSDPNAAKAARAVISCPKCQGGLKAYAGLERVPESEAKGYIWYENLPESYMCSCRQLALNLSLWKRNLHGLLGQSVSNGEKTTLVPLYEKSALQNIHANFTSLLQEPAREEIFQKFLEENPVLLHQFSPEKLFVKAPILSLRKTDFAIVNHQHELILIELERPDTRLLKADGNIHSELQRALGQPREWLQHADNHRGAVLTCIGVEQREIGAVRAVVIAGRDAEYDREHLRTLKSDPTYGGRIRVMTYDDLLANFRTLVRRVESL